MILWTIQPKKIYDEIMRTGRYRCDFNKSHMTAWKYQYDWLVQEMKSRIGKPPKGVTYPVWAWYMWESRRKKPDLRREKWENGTKGDRFVCMEIDIPENRLLLSDFDLWSIILLNSLISESEEEYRKLKAVYDSLPEKDRRTFREQNWKKAFNITPYENDWICRGSSIQATFWELRREDINSIRRFTSASNPDSGQLRAE